MLLPTDLVLNLYCHPIYEPQNILKSTHVGQENQHLHGGAYPQPP